MSTEIPAAAVEAAARRQWRDEHGAIWTPDHLRTPESDEVEQDRAYADWDSGRVNEHVKVGYRRRADHALTAALPHILAPFAALAGEWSCNCGGPSPEGHHEMHCDSVYGLTLRALLSPTSPPAPVEAEERELIVTTDREALAGIIGVAVIDKTHPRLIADAIIAAGWTPPAPVVDVGPSTAEVEAADRYPYPANLHIGRSWTGHEIEDACPCQQAACGLVACTNSIGVGRSDCPEHSYAAARTIRQVHDANQCPARAVTPEAVDKK